MFNFNYQFDRISFWLGFLAATLLWWVFSRIRPFFPQWRDNFVETLRTLSQRNLSGIELYLRKETLRRAQRQHIAAPLFALDEILVEPWLMTPPAGQDPSVEVSNPSIAGQVVPYLPDWPELAAPFGYPTLKPVQALRSGRHLAFIGPPGIGKTVALAHLASLVARKDPQTGKYAEAIPLFIHALELDSTLEEGRDPLLNLTRVISSNASVVMQPQIPRYLTALFRDKQRKVVLLLDGLDELNAVQLSAMLTYLTAFVKKHPRLQIVTTASSDYLDGLTKAGIYPLAVSAWTPSTRASFARQWGAAWSSLISPEIKKQSKIVEVDRLLIENWLATETAYTSPLEWTMRLWGAYAGDLSGSSGLGILDTHLSRYLPTPALMGALEMLGHQMAQNNTASLAFEEAEKILSRFAPTRGASLEQDGTPVAVTGVGGVPAVKERKTDKKARGSAVTSQGERIINALTAGGILVEYANHQVRFTNPTFLGFFAGLRTTYGEAEQMVAAWKEKVSWPVTTLVLHYAAACNENPGWVYPLIEAADAPLFRCLLTPARWLKDVSPNAEWRGHLMRAMIGHLQNDLLPLGSRVRLVAGFTLSGDPSMTKLFRQLLLSRSRDLRRAALLGCGAIGSPQLINDMLGMLADTDPKIRYTACLSLSAVPVDAPLNAVVQVLLSGDEEIRQASAESLAQIKPDGHKVLEEAAEEDDLLTRRAAVFGLMQIHEPWARERLDRMAVEDGQWVVRNAAGQAVEFLQQTTPALPKALPRPSDSPWLLTFASKMGMGLLPGHPATDVLLSVLKSGSPAEQVAALYYLRDQADEGIVAAIYHLLYSGEEELSEPALHALWWIMLSGMKLPAPGQFGLG